jgi:hypothetical protein
MRYEKRSTKRVQETVVMVLTKIMKDDGENDGGVDACGGGNDDDGDDADDDDGGGRGGGGGDSDGREMQNYNATACSGKC